MGAFQREAEIRHHPNSIRFRIEGIKNATNEDGIMNQPLGRSPSPWHEGQRRDLIPKRKNRFLATRIIFGAMGRKHPQSIGVFLPRALDESDLRFHLSFRIELGGPNAISHSSFMHEVNEE